MHQMRDHNKPVTKPFINSDKNIEVASDSKHRKWKPTNNPKEHVRTPTHRDNKPENKIRVAFLRTQHHPINRKMLLLKMLEPKFSQKTLPPFKTKLPHTSQLVNNPYLLKLWYATIMYKMFIINKKTYKSWSKRYTKRYITNCRTSFTC